MNYIRLSIFYIFVFLIFSCKNETKELSNSSRNQIIYNSFDFFNLKGINEIKNIPDSTTYFQTTTEFKKLKELLISTKSKDYGNYTYQFNFFDINGMLATSCIDVTYGKKWDAEIIILHDTNKKKITKMTFLQQEIQSNKEMSLDKIEEYSRTNNKNIYKIWCFSPNNRCTVICQNKLSETLDKKNIDLSRLNKIMENNKYCEYESKKNNDRIEDWDFYTESCK